MDENILCDGNDSCNLDLKERILFYLSAKPLRTCRQISEDLCISYKNINRKLKEMHLQGIVEKKMLRYKLSERYIAHYQKLYKNLANSYNNLHLFDDKSEFSDLFNHIADKSIIDEINVKIDLFVANKLDKWFNMIDQNTKNEIDKIVFAIKSKFGNRRDLNILDIGCKTGRLTFNLAKIYKNVLGIDHNKKYIRYCKRKAKKLFIDCKFKYSKIDLTKSELRYDVIIISKINFHTLENKDIIIENLKSKLNKGGIIIILDLVESSQLLHFLKEFRDYDLDKYKSNRNETFDEFAKKGFRVLHEVIEQNNVFKSNQEVFEIYKIAALYYDPLSKWTDDDLEKLKEYMFSLKSPLVHDNSYWFTIIES